MQDYQRDDFTPLDSSQLNDLRRRVVSHEEVTDEELKHAIQTCLYEDRENAVKKAAPKKKAARAKPLPADANLDDLLVQKVK